MSVWTWLTLGGAAVLALAVVAELRRRLQTSARGRRFFRHPTAALGLFVLAFFVTIALAAPVVAPYPPYYQIDIGHPNRPPSAQFLLGTDPFSRDVWSRLVYGARVSLGIGALAIGNVKFKVQRALFEKMRSSDRPVFLDFRDAFELARELSPDSGH